MDVVIDSHYKCPWGTCDKTYATASGLRTHVAKHTPASKVYYHELCRTYFAAREEDTNCRCTISDRFAGCVSTLE